MGMQDKCKVRSKKNTKTLPKSTAETVRRTRHILRKQERGNTKEGRKSDQRGMMNSAPMS